MNRYNFIRDKKMFFLSLLLSLSITSCEKGLNLEPEDVITNASFFKVTNDFKLFATKLYEGLPRPSYEDRRSDISYNDGGNSISNGSLIAPQIDAFWDGSFKTIRACNLLISKIETANESLKSSIEIYNGEAHFFRAMAYYRLMKNFGGVPIINEVLTTSSEELQTPRNTREEVTTFIIKDLNAAITSLPESVTDNNVGRLTQLAAKAYKARITLFEGTWRKYHGGDGADKLLDMAIESSNAVITSGIYELFDRRDVLADESYRLFFTLDSDGLTNPAGLTKNDNKETIIARRYDKDIRSSEYFMPLVDIRTMNPTKAIMDLFLCTDGLPISKSPLFKGYDNLTDEYENRDPRMVTMMYIPGHRYWHHQQAVWRRDWSKPNENGFIYFKNANDWGGRTATGFNGRKFTQEIEGPRGSDYPVLRLAEVYLVYAEALYERNGTITDENLNNSINKLRDRVGLPHLTNSFATDNGLDLREEIRRERTIELSYEGFRYDDIRRWKIAENVLPKPLRGLKWTNTAWTTDERYKDVTQNLDAEGYVIVEDNRTFDATKNYLLPLPEKQLELNKALTQNPGW